MTRPHEAGTPSPVGIARPAPAVIAIVRASCAAVADRPVALAEAFYAHLFEMAPQVRAMFPADMTGQMQKMSDTLFAAIAHLDAADTTALEATLQRLGRTHSTHYHVEREHYHYIGHALTRAVRDVAGGAYSGYMSSAWIAVYQWVAAHMTAGADTPEPSAAQRPPLSLPEPRQAAEHGRPAEHGAGAEYPSSSATWAR